MLNEKKCKRMMNHKKLKRRDIVISAHIVISFFSVVARRMKSTCSAHLKLFC